MKSQILLLLFTVSFLIAESQIYSVGNDDGFSFSCYSHNPYHSIYSVGNDDGFSFACIDLDDDGESLPIELVLFEAACNNGSVNLKWATASETNNDYFTVEKSVDGLNWSTADIVAGAGNSSQLIQYSYTDAEPINIISYYRLKQTDFNGLYEYSKIVSANCTDNSFVVLVYPNPVSEEVTIEISGSITPVNFEILDTQGSLIYSGNLTEKTTLQTNSFPPGVYIIKVENGIAFKLVKIIKE